jgi:NAD(P)-dependent dehydrogenase (short-subunit alcohol dehydrogenase family)
MTQKTALITGASRGLGSAMAEQLALQGWHVVAVARTTGGLEDLDDRVKSHKLPGTGGLTLAPMDVTNDDAMRHLCLSVHQRWGGLQLWVHTAIHAAPLSPTGTLDGKDWDKTIATNIRATGQLIPMIDPLLKAGEGTAVFLDDPRAGQKFFGAYGASKAAQIALARSWAAETVRIGPRVVILTPEPLPTATRARFFPGEDRSQLASLQTEATRLISLI